MAFDSTELLASIRQRAMLPAVSAEGTADADLLRVATEELRSTLVPKILALREELFVKSQLQYLVSGQRAYRIPARAAGKKLNRVYLVDSDGRERSGALTRIAPSEQADYPLSGTPVAFYTEANSIILVPTPTAGDTSLRLGMSYYFRQSQLIATSAAAKVLSFNAGTNQLTVDTAFATSPLTGLELFDFIRADGEPLLLDQAPISFTIGPPHYFIVPPDVGTQLAYGDWVAYAQQSPVPYLPEDLLTWLAQATAVKLLASLGDNENLGAAVAEFEKLERGAVVLLNPRIDAQPRLMVSNDLLCALE